MFKIGDFVIGVGSFEHRALQDEIGVIIEISSNPNAPYKVDYDKFVWWCPGNNLRKVKILENYKNLLID